ncbi:hypothetical protein MN032_10950 [Agromyces atrinae]|uniref:hypothetical protein n=1 Tax=Agromyces atrinae TaxID=592376 RepID=UPI001F55ACEA|nr:hypothetical protein [Agromyces atrinae]MCI2958215.1 hypothetical protein [Agromyces atrinae]
MKAGIKVGLAGFEIKNIAGEYVLFAGGYGREQRRVGVLDGPENASLAYGLLLRGVRDVAPIIWETGEPAPDDEAADRR